MFGRKTNSSGWRVAATHSSAREFTLFDLLVATIGHLRGMNNEKPVSGGWPTQFEAVQGTVSAYFIPLFALAPLAIASRRIQGMRATNDMKNRRP
jgi:hypothetical protein